MTASSLFYNKYGNRYKNIVNRRFFSCEPIAISVLLCIFDHNNRNSTSTNEKHNTYPRDHPYYPRRAGVVGQNLRARQLGRSGARRRGDAQGGTKMSLEPMPPYYDAWKTDPEWGIKPEQDDRDDYDKEREREDRDE